MALTVMLTDAELRDVADEVLKREMLDFPYLGADVTSAEDWSGEPSIYVVAKVGPGVPAVDGAVSSRIHGALHEAVLARGEVRFPYFRIDRSDDQIVEDDAEADWP